MRVIRGPIGVPASLSSPEAYWSQHTVHVREKGLSSAEASLDYFQWRCDQYPGYLELMPVHGLDGLDVVDYGCGPGHDLVGFGVYSRPRSLIGLDVSERALSIARQRLAVHDFGSTVRLERLVDSRLPLEDSSIDFIHSSGVLHHVADLEAVLREFGRVLRPEGLVRIMVYNRDSLMWHLYVPYYLQIRKRILDPAIPIETAFRMSTDGFECPVSLAYTTESFASIARSAGLSTRYVGTSISQFELRAWSRYGRDAVADLRLDEEHREFLRAVRVGEDGSLSRNGRVPGLNLTLELRQSSG